LAQVALLQEMRGIGGARSCVGWASCRSTPRQQSVDVNLDRLDSASLPAQLLQGSLGILGPCVIRVVEVVDVRRDGLKTLPGIRAIPGTRPAAPQAL
jgi:hypothetical protein